jgi:hypothetical protein
MKFLIVVLLFAECISTVPQQKKELPYCEYICGKGDQWTGMICADKNKIRSTCK